MRLCGLRSLLWILPVDLGLALNTTPKRVWASFPNNPRWVHSESGAPGWLLLVFVVQFSLRKTEQNPDEESRLCSYFSPPARGQSPPIVASSTVRLLDGRPVFRCWWALANSVRRGRVYD